LPPPAADETGIVKDMTPGFDKDRHPRNKSGQFVDTPTAGVSGEQLARLRGTDSDDAARVIAEAVFSEHIGELEQIASGSWRSGPTLDNSEIMVDAAQVDIPDAFRSLADEHGLIRRIMCRQESSGRNAAWEASDITDSDSTWEEISRNAPGAFEVQVLAGDTPEETRMVLLSSPDTLHAIRLSEAGSEFSRLFLTEDALLVDCERWGQNQFARSWRTLNGVAPPTIEERLDHALARSETFTPNAPIVGVLRHALTLTSTHGQDQTADALWNDASVAYRSGDDATVSATLQTLGWMTGTRVDIYADMRRLDSQ
jgi:hypothetical protein